MIRAMIFGVCIRAFDFWQEGHYLKPESREAGARRLLQGLSQASWLCLLFSRPLRAQKSLAVFAKRAAASRDSNHDVTDFTSCTVFRNILSIN